MKNNNEKGFIIGKITLFILDPRIKKSKRIYRNTSTRNQTSLYKRVQRSLGLARKNS